MITTGELLNVCETHNVRRTYYDLRRALNFLGVKLDGPYVPSDRIKEVLNLMGVCLFKTANNLVELKGKTRRGRSAIKSWGQNWRVLDTRGSSLFVVSSEDQTGDNNNIPVSARWVDSKEDRNFEVTNV